MNQDIFKENFEYPSFLPLETVIQKPEKYIIPECREACRQLWLKNIFTVSCSTRREWPIRYIFISTLSDENKKLFEDYHNLHPQNYCLREHNGKTFYGISLYDKISDIDTVSSKLINLISSLEKQNVLEGFLSLKDYFKKYMTPYPNYPEIENLEESELIERIKLNLAYHGKEPFLLDTEKKIVYLHAVYKLGYKGYLDYLEHLKKQSPTNPDRHDNR